MQLKISVRTRRDGFQTLFRKWQIKKDQNEESLFEAGIGRQITSHPFLISKPSSEFQLSTLFALFRWINVTNTACRVSDEEYQTKFGSRSQHKRTHELTLLTTEKSIRITSYLGSPLQRYWKEHTDNLIFDHRSFYCHI